MPKSSGSRGRSKSRDRSKSRRRSKSEYHNWDICGDNFLELAETIQNLLRQNSFLDAIKQLRRCVEARIKSSQKYEGGGDLEHKQAIYAVGQLLQQVLEISGHNLDRATLAGIEIRFIDANRAYNFYIYVPPTPLALAQPQPKLDERGRSRHRGGTRKTKKNRK
jgi:hypothetical protein